MPRAFGLALLLSLLVHLAALFGPDVSLSWPDLSPPPPLQASLRPLPAARPAPPVVHPMPAAPARPRRQQVPARSAASATPVAAPAPAAPEASTAPATESPPPAIPAPPPARPASPVLAESGVIRFAIWKSSLAMQVGVAEHRWQFDPDGSYKLQAMSRTSGLAGLFRPIRIEQESRGQLAPWGLSPMQFVTRRNGEATADAAEFDPAAGTVRLGRDGSVVEVAQGTQDLLSLFYQLAYIRGLADGSALGVVTGRKYERYAIDALGEETLTTPAGEFRTLHLRALTDTTTEIWLAPEKGYLPVKIRFTDRKGDTFEQIVTELGSP